MMFIRVLSVCAHAHFIYLFFTRRGHLPCHMCEYQKITFESPLSPLQADLRVQIQVVGPCWEHLYPLSHLRGG